MTLDVYSFSNQGGRSHNEDAVGVKKTEHGGLFVLADGLGGHQFGERASKCVVDSLLGAQLPQEGEAPEKWLEKQSAQANQKLLALQKECHAIMKSTVVALLIGRNGAAFANVGDSRLYFIRDDAITGMTRDHSVAYKKYEAGEITRAQIGTDEDQSSLIRSLGKPDHFEAESYGIDGPLQEGDAFLLCSDGMWEYILDEEILVDYLKADSASAWAELLLLRAMDHFPPKNDNLSLIAVIVGQ